MQIHIKNVHIHTGRPPAMATALLSAMFQSMGSPGAGDSPLMQSAERPEKATFKIGEHSAAVGGVYAGIVPGDEGQPDAHLFLLDAKPDTKLSWADGVKWAESLGDGARLPSRFESALLYANVQTHLDTEAWHWTGTQYSDSCAWHQTFSYGYQLITYFKVAEGRCRAVRRLVL